MTDPISATSLISGGRWEGKVGVVNGIPNRTTISETLGLSATAAQINTAIDNCPSGQVVQLSAGTMSTSPGAINLDKSNVTLRGAVDANGLPSTILRDFYLVIGAQNGWDVSDSTKFTNRDVSSGSTRGSTTLTLTAAPTGLSVGQIMWISAPSSANVTGAGNWSDWFGTRPFTQTVKVTNVSGNDVSFSPALNADYLSGTIQIHYRGTSNTISLSGVENVSLTVSGAGSANHYIQFYGTDECWAKNCKTYDVQSSRYHFYVYATFRTEIRRCDAAHMRDYTSSTYCILPVHSSGVYIEDNIFHDCPNVMPMFGLNASAFSYNHCIDHPYNPPEWLSQIVFFHGSHNHYNLLEGNIYAANYHDSGAGSRNNVFFRNRIVGWDAADGGKTSNTQCITTENHHDYLVVAGNVMGKDGYHTVYNGQIFNIDSTSDSTLDRIANYNYVNDAIPAAEALSGGEVLETSYLYSSEPSWWRGDVTWPPISPTTPSNQSIPAERRYNGSYDYYVGTPQPPLYVRSSL